MRILVESRRKMSNTSFHRRCSGRQKFWWLRSVDRGEFVRIPEVRGDEYFEMQLDLPPGTYTLGCGPRGDFGVREEFTVSVSAGEGSE